MAIASAAGQQTRFWTEPAADLLLSLRTSAEGLTQADAAERLRATGPNVLHTRRRRSIVLQFLGRFTNPLVAVLLVASGITAYLGETTSFYVISAIVLMSVSLDFIQEFRADSAAERLRSRVALRACVLRDGVAMERPATELVPGDIVRLAAGDLIPADGRVLEAHDFFINQSFLTGESFPVEKRPDDHDNAVDGAAAANTVYLGTSTISGNASMLVVCTGRETALAEIGGSLERAAPPNAFERGTQSFGLLILRCTLFLVLFVMLVNFAYDRPLLESFLFAVALAVGLTPELLPMVISVTLARGALRMSQRQVIVKRLSAVQNLGAMEVLCTDKTGTLTEGRIRLERHIDAAGQDSSRVLELACLNSRFESGLRSPMDDAILAHGEIDTSGWNKIDEVPFDFERRRVSVLLERKAERLLIVKGAPEDMLARCTHYELAGRVCDLDAATRTSIRKLFMHLGDDGFRTLAVAWRRVAPEHQHAVVHDEDDLVFCGFAGFLDPPKPSAGPALAALAAHGVRVKVVTGDNERVTRHICRELQIGVTGVLNGDDLRNMDDAALAMRAESVNLFCRVTPSQKARILLALKSRGHVVGFMGDGINDAPSLHVADVGLSVDNAVDVAREAADLILLQQDLHVLLDGVREGRRTLANVMKYIMMATSSNFGNMFSMAGGTLVLAFLPMLPLQILLNNLLYDLSELALPFDRVDEESLLQPSSWDMAFVQRCMLSLGPVSSLFDAATFIVLLQVFDAGPALFQTGWFMESVASQVLVVFIIRTRHAPWTSRPDPRVVLAAAAVTLAAFLVPLGPWAGALGFVRPPMELYAVLGVVVTTYLVVMEGAKRAFYRYAARRHD